MSSVQEVDGRWTLVASGQSRAIHSRHPEREADRQAAEVLAADPAPALIVAIGLGLGYLLEALDRRAWTGHVLALEPEPGTIAPLLARGVCRTWMDAGRLKVLAGPDFHGASTCWSLFGDGAAEPAVFVNPSIARARPVDVARGRELAARLRHEARSNAEARRKLGGRYLLNTLRNLQAIASEGDVRTLRSIADGCPCVLVAAGPSLDHALPALREVQDRALLIAVDTALRPLLAAGITPHLVVGADPSEGNARHLTDLPDCSNTFLVAEGSLDPVALPAFRGRTFFYTVADHHPWPWLRSQGRDVGTLRAWGSVLTIAFDLALQMGCGEIAFVGADLAYTGDRPYCRGVAFEEDWRRRAEWGQPLDDQWAVAIAHHPRIAATDVTGAEARTAPHLVAFRNWLLEQMRGDTKRIFINASGAGILHGDGITQVSPDALRTRLGRFPASPVRDRVKRAYQAVNPNALMQAARAVASDEAVMGEWHAFAPGLGTMAIRDALDAACRPGRVARPVEGAGDGRPRAAQAVPVYDWLDRLSRNVPLVPLRLAPERLVEWSPTGARIFHFRTTAARIAFAALQMPEGALTESGRPLKQAPSVNDLVPGSYRMCRDELHVMASDGSDPRSNGRDYAMLVPRCIAELESFPLQEILDRGL